PSGAAVLGMADVVVTNDPITAQGSNSASKCAASYLESIIHNGDGEFCQQWMQRTFDTFWATAAPVTRWTNAMLAPHPPHMLRILGAASRYPQIANRFAEAFNNPEDTDWILDPTKAAEYLASVQGPGQTTHRRPTRHPA